jgi:hypothetical protein
MSELKKSISGHPDVDLYEDRENVIHFLESQLIGPNNGSSESLSIRDKPYERYLMGALFPVGAGNRDSEDDESGGTGGADDDDDPISLAYQMRPASLGISFSTKADSVSVGIAGALYLKDGEKWKRREFGTSAKPICVKVSSQAPNHDSIDGIEARLASVWRRQNDRWLVTVVLVNKRQAKGGRFGADDLLYQVALKCAPEGGAVEAYPVPDRFSWDEEEEELALMYRSKNTFAIGHGTSARWDPNFKGSVDCVETTFLPRYEVAPVTAELDPNDSKARSRAYSPQFLASDKVSAGTKLQELSKLASAYSIWVLKQVEIAKTVDKFRDAPGRLLARMHEAILRVGKGLKLLAEDSSAMRCFVLANRAMHMQSVHSKSEKYAKTIKSKGHEYVDPDYSSAEWDGFKWYPFQLAFQLLVIESLANQNSTERDVVDLIWFPTGGGKTEAYLAVAAFELFYRRIKYGDSGGGTAVIKRYTLRLLTTQQFERVSALVCACEVIRQSHPEELGMEPITLGLWVGEDSTPNSYQVANQKYVELVRKTNQKIHTSSRSVHGAAPESFRKAVNRI